MSELRELYQQVILDHNKNPRNFYKMEEANRVTEGYNPLCGDHYTIYVQVEDGIIQNISFFGSGCAISKASASVMSSLLKGKTIDDAERLFEQFHEVVTGNAEKGQSLENFVGKLAVFKGVCEYPTRVKCATLPWHTMHSALHETSETVSTE